MYGGGAKPIMGNGKRWIDHIVCAMGRVIEKFDLYIQHLKRAIPTIKQSNDRATVQEKLNKLVDAKVLLRSCGLTDVLTEAKRFCLISPKKEINVIKMLKTVETTESNYQRFLAKLNKRPQFIFKLPNLKLVIDAISSSEDEVSLYQRHKS